MPLAGCGCEGPGRVTGWKQADRPREPGAGRTEAHRATSVCDAGIHAASVQAAHCSQTVWTVPEYLRAPRLRQRFLPEPGHGRRGLPLARGRWWPSPLFPEPLGGYVWGLGVGSTLGSRVTVGLGVQLLLLRNILQAGKFGRGTPAGGCRSGNPASPPGFCPSSQIGGTTPRGANDLPAEPAVGFAWLRAEKRGDAPPAQGGKVRVESLRTQETAASGRHAGVRHPLRPETPARPAAVASDRCPCP